MRLALYDLLGREVSVLVDERMESGVHKITFTAGDGMSGSSGGSATGGERRRFASGIYLYRLQAGDFVATRKMILVN